MQFIDTGKAIMGTFDFSEKEDLKLAILNNIKCKKSYFLIEHLYYCRIR